MAYNFRARQFDPPPLLHAIYATKSPKDRMNGFCDFLFYKSNRLQLPLTREERMFDDTIGMFGVIPADGWPSVFDQSYDWLRLSGILEVLRFCGHEATADTVQEARELFYNGRTDLHTIEARRQAGIRGFRHPTERRRFYALGDMVEQLPCSETYWQLLRWPDAHRSEFIDFPRQ